MKGPFGVLLIGGGIILLVGLFTGKIVFHNGTVPGSNPIQNVVNAITTPQKLVGKNAQKLPAGVVPDPNKIPVFNPQGKACPSGYVMASDGNCYTSNGI